MNRWIPALGLLCLATLIGCQDAGRTAEPGLSRARFIEINVALRSVEGEGEATDSIRRAILEEHGVTEEELRAFAQARRARPGELASVWEEIRRTLLDARDSLFLEEPGSVEAGGAAIERDTTAVRPAGTTVRIRTGASAEGVPVRVPADTASRAPTPAVVETVAPADTAPRPAPADPDAPGDQTT